LKETLRENLVALRIVVSADSILAVESVVLLVVVVPRHVMWWSLQVIGESLVFGRGGEKQQGRVGGPNAYYRLSDSSSIDLTNVAIVLALHRQ